MQLVSHLQPKSLRHSNRPNSVGCHGAGSQVFIQTWQVISGWEDDFKETNAVVPGG